MRAALFRITSYNVCYTKLLRLNRVVDAEIDARNPRTAGRHLPTGRLTKKELLAFTAVMGAVLVAATAMLNWLCVALLPVAAVMIIGYSYTKRFTWLCHYWLGAACAAAPMSYNFV